MYQRKVTSIYNVICLCFIIVVYSSAEEECDKTKCPGPLKFYEDVECKPIKENPEDCCAVKYDCSHLKERSKSKCYVNGNVYELGESLKPEDALPCDVGCVCREGHDGIASFNCAIVDCPPSFPPSQEGCFRERSPMRCCPGREICNRTRATCVVDGKTYNEGEYFELKDDPSASCTCQLGYKGENVEPFCRRTTNYCRAGMRRSYEIHNNCAPVYYSNQSPQTSCSVFYRCQNKNDTLISNTDVIETDKTNTCLFGTIEMQKGDELNQATDYSSVCVKCVCEVPPIPTCQRLPDEKCDVTKHPNF